MANPESCVRSEPGRGYPPRVGYDPLAESPLHPSPPLIAAATARLDRSARGGALVPSRRPWQLALRRPVRVVSAAPALRVPGAAAAVQQYRVLDPEPGPRHLDIR